MQENCHQSYHLSWEATFLQLGETLGKRVGTTAPTQSLPSASLSFYFGTATCAMLRPPFSARCPLHKRCPLPLFLCKETGTDLRA